MSERISTGLAPEQADGRACVMSGRDFRTPGSSAVPVGRSDTGSQVFAFAAGLRSWADIQRRCGYIGDAEHARVTELVVGDGR